MIQYAHLTATRTLTSVNSTTLSVDLTALSTGSVRGSVKVSVLILCITVINNIQVNIFSIYLISMQPNEAIESGDLHKLDNISNTNFSNAFKYIL